MCGGIGGDDVCREVIKISKTERGKRDGSGPYKDSAQRRSSKIGKRRQAGAKCPKR